MTLVSKNRELPDLRPVNYIGDAVDYAEAYEILLDWPLGQRMDINGFAEHGAHYIRIGDDESSDKIKCRFMMSYYMEDYAVSISMLDEVFERYFFRQVRLSQDEFESIR